MNGKLLQTTLMVIMTILFTMSLAAQNKGEMDVESLRNYWIDQYNQDQPKGIEYNTLKWERIAKATPDETFYGIGDPRNSYNPMAIHETTDSTIAKTNQAYVWGLTQDGNKLFYGTGPNIHCIVLGSYLGLTLPHQADCWACEFGESKFSPPLPPSFGDWRPSRMFSYDLNSDTQTEITPLDPKLNTTFGIRSAGNLNGVILMGGPDFNGGINIFAFNSQTNAYLGSANVLFVPGTTVVANNVRKWVVIDEVLYVGIGTQTGGAILKWTGSLANPFLFENVGTVDGQAAELAEHDGKLFVTTWPVGAAKLPAIAGLWMSPEIPVGGLTNANANQWQKVWAATDYEPDMVVAATYGGGALKSFQGKLYWGTMHVPLVSALYHLNTFPAPTLNDTLAAIQGTHRAISVFCGDNFNEPDENITLLYGNEQLPAYIPGTGWQLVPNKMNAKPAYGPSGIWSLFNNYTWTMETYNGELYIGTMDWSFLLYGGLGALIEMGFTPPVKDGTMEYKAVGDFSFPIFYFGADLFRIPTSNSMAIPVDVMGVGNYLNYGVRTMVSDNDHLYLGTANPMNLAPQGGWEVIKMSEDEYTFTVDNYKIDLLTRNKADETFYGIGDPRNNFNPYIDHFTTETTIAKHNQSYVWGLAATDDGAWIGTGPNVLQLVFGGYLGMDTPAQTESFVAEFGESQFSPPYPATLGDWRPARILKWDETTQTQIDLTPTFAQAPLLQSTVGMRSAGTIGNLVILAGPNLAVDHFGVNFYAFNNDNNQYLGSFQILIILGDEINNIRKWINYEGVSYTGVSGADNGYIIRWTGDVNNPFQYEVVGIIDAAPAEFTVHEGRLVTSCWPGGGELGSPSGGLPGVWYSPVIPAGGLTWDNRNGWTELWESSDYEVDPVLQRMMAGGAIESFDGKLYWGSMHVPFMAALAHLKTYFGENLENATEEDVINALNYCHRAISIFRADNLGQPDQEIELLYGEESLSAYHPALGWMTVPNASGLQPLYGASGFGNGFNNYTWTMSVFDNQLFIGTMDWSYVLSDGMPLLVNTLLNLMTNGQIQINWDDVTLFHAEYSVEGADIWSIAGTNSVAVPVTLNGMGNRLNYGVRTMALATDKLYLGSANAMNLKEDGGWELYSLTGFEGDFITNKPQANPGDEITFFPELGNTKAANLTWHFPDGTPEYSNDLNPKVSFGEPGLHDVILDIEENGNTRSIYKEGYVEILPIDEAQCMDYFNGWGLVSSYMTPDNPDLEILLDDIISNDNFGELVIMFNNSGIFWPAYNFNTLINWNTYQGYKIKMTAYNSNCIFGETLPVKEVNFPTGFHYLPVLSNIPVSTDDLFDGAPLVYALNLYTGDIYWPAGGVYSLTTLYPGIAYMVSLTQPHTFVFPEGKNTKSLTRMPAKPFNNPTTVWETPVNTGAVQVVSIYSDALAAFSANDVLGAFSTDDRCVGMSTIENINSNLGMVIYGDDKTTTAKDGLNEGEIIRFRVLNGGQAKEIYPVFDQKLPYHNGRFAENGFSGITAFKASATDILVDEIAGLEIYPNPAIEVLHVNCPLQDGITEITISSLQGQLLLKSNLAAESSSFDISNLESGIYLIKIRNNNKTVVRQLIKK